MNKINPSSTTTKAVEHFHSLAHRKTMVQTVQEYIQSWPFIVRETAKSLCTWSFQMFSGFKSSYYLMPEKNRIPLSGIPMMPKLPNMNKLSKEENRQAKELCQEHRALPQSSTRSFTSKFKAGTLPLQAYLADDPDVEDENLGAREDETEPIEETPVNESIEEFVDEPPEWDTDCSDDEAEDVQEDGSNEAGFCHVNQNLVTRSGRRIMAGYC